MIPDPDHTLAQMKLELTRLRLDVVALQSSASCGNVLKFFMLVVFFALSYAVGNIWQLLLARL